MRAFVCSSHYMEVDSRAYICEGGGVSFPPSALRRSMCTCTCQHRCFYCTVYWNVECGMWNVAKRNGSHVCMAGCILSSSPLSPPLSGIIVWASDIIVYCCASTRVDDSSHLSTPGQALWSVAVREWLAYGSSIAHKTSPNTIVARRVRTAQLHPTRRQKFPRIENSP